MIINIMPGNVAKLRLGVVDDFRTLDWVRMVKYPELVNQYSLRLLQV